MTAFPAPALHLPHAYLLESVISTAAAQHRQPVILFDMDGNLFDWTTRFDELLTQIDPDYKIVPEAERTGMGYFKTPGTDPAVYRRALDHPDLYRDLPPIEGAVEAFHATVEAGFDVFLCTTPTWTNPGCVEGKLQSVRRHLGAEFAERTIMTHDKTMVFGDILFDDNPAVSGARTADWEHVMFDQPYNRSAPAAFRLLSWPDWTRTLAGRS